MTSAQQPEAHLAKNPAVSPALEQALLAADLGRISYADAYAQQRRLQQSICESRGQPGAPIGHLLLLEHDPPVITVSRRPGAAQHLLATPQLLASRGIEIAQTDRGGDITYHGPGQLVAYAILDLNRLKLSLRSYMRWLEQIVIDTLAVFDIQGRRDACATGVWVQTAGASPLGETCPALPTDQPTAKVCAMGVRISRWVSMHGLALNVDPDLDHFRLIVPCGLEGRSVTSMRTLLGDTCPPIQEVKQTLTHIFLKAAASRTTATTD